MSKLSDVFVFSDGDEEVSKSSSAILSSHTGSMYARDHQEEQEHADLVYAIELSKAEVVREKKISEIESKYDELQAKRKREMTKSKLSDVFEIGDSDEEGNLVKKRAICTANVENTQQIEIVISPPARQISKGFEVINVLPTRGFDEDDPLAMELMKAERQFYRMQAKNYNMNYKIQSVDVVRNEQLKLNFEAKKAELMHKGSYKKGEDLLVFHGTPQNNILNILKKHRENREKLP